MKRSLTILSIMLISMFIGGKAYADDGLFLSSASNPNFGTQIATALDCTMPSSIDGTTKKIERWSESRKDRYNQYWEPRLRGLVYQNYSHQYTRTQVNDMSETELANLLRTQPHMVDTIHNMRGRCARRSGSRTASKTPVVETPATQAYPTPDEMWSYAVMVSSYQAKLAEYERSRKAKEELAAAQEAKRKAEERLAKAESDVGEDANAERVDELAKAREADNNATERLRQAREAVDNGGGA